MKRITAALLLCCASITAQADGFLDAKGLKETIEKGGQFRTFAAGYITAVSDANDGQLVCVTNGTTASSLTEAVHKALVMLPDLHEIPADVFVVNVLGYLWPCKNQNKRKQGEPQIDRPVFRRSL